MKELEHVLQRVRIRGADGIERKLKESIYAVMRVLADATDRNAPELGCQISIQELCRRSRKERSTVWEALAGARRLKLLTRHDPGNGARYATFINLISIRLVEASQKSRPYLGSIIVFDEPPSAPRTPSKNAELKTDKLSKTQEICASQPVLDVQNLDFQILDGEHVLNTPPRLTAGAGIAAGDGDGDGDVAAGGGVSASAASLLSPCTASAGGCGVREFAVFTDSNFSNFDFLDLETFSDFLVQQNVGVVTTFCQRRKKKDGKRGGVFFKSQPENYDDLKYQIERAAYEKFEMTMNADRLLLVDDLTEKTLELFVKHCFTSIVIETSLGNFQALLSTGQGWTDAQVRSTQRALAKQFGGDGNATAAMQPHRLPGSLNLKNGGKWVTRLHSILGGRLIEPIEVADEYQSQKLVVSQQVGHRSLNGRDNTPSGLDFGRACQLLLAGQSVGTVEAEIEKRAADRGRHGDHFEYSKRTIRAAISRLAQ